MHGLNLNANLSSLSNTNSLTNGKECKVQLQFIYMLKNHMQQIYELYVDIDILYTSLQLSAHRTVMYVIAHATVMG
jgi:hypothetical protein